MKLRDKKTGEIVKLESLTINHNGNLMLTYTHDGQRELETYGSFAALNARWEDASEKPKKYWFIDSFGNITLNEISNKSGDDYTDMTDLYESQKQIGNYFETREEAKRAVEKLKAWKRLKDKGFQFEETVYKTDDGIVKITAGFYGGGRW